jgi:hypothetical protein
MNPVSFSEIKNLTHYNPHLDRPSRATKGVFVVFLWDDYLETFTMFKHRSMAAAEKRFRSLVRKAVEDRQEVRILLVNDYSFEVQRAVIESYG